MLERQNCWEYMECGRGPNGFEVDIYGVCSTAASVEADGLNGGKNGGRICWAITGTFVSGDVTGKYACDKFSCANCDFFKLVSEEQDVNNLELVTPVQMTQFNNVKLKARTQFFEKRSSERSSANLNACFSYRNIDYSGKVTNISETGMFITARDMFYPDDEQFDLQLEINNKHLTLPVRRCRLTVSPDLNNGMGIEILNPPQSYLVSIKKLNHHY
jgi:hypothetical protein